jgi:hypothetical protein
MGHHQIHDLERLWMTDGTRPPRAGPASCWSLEYLIERGDPAAGRHGPCTRATDAAARGRGVGGSSSRSQPRQIHLPLGPAGWWRLKPVFAEPRERDTMCLANHKCAGFCVQGALCAANGSALLDVHFQGRSTLGRHCGLSSTPQRWWSTWTKARPSRWRLRLSRTRCSSSASSHLQVQARSAIVELIDSIHSRTSHAVDRRQQAPVRRPD